MFFLYQSMVIGSPRSFYSRGWLFLIFEMLLYRKALLFHAMLP
jgi:hypothetical protein